MEKMLENRYKNTPKMEAQRQPQTTLDPTISRPNPDIDQGTPKGSQNGAKREPKGCQKGAKREPQGSQKGAQIQPKLIQSGARSPEPTESRERPQGDVERRRKSAEGTQKISKS